MRGLTAEERGLLRHLAGEGDRLNEVTTIELHMRLTRRGLLKHWVDESPDCPGEEADFWTINDHGRLALRVCTVTS